MFVIYQEHGSMSVFQSENNLLILTGGGGVAGWGVIQMLR